MSKKFRNFRVKYQESNIGFENLAYLQSIENKCKKTKQSQVAFKLQIFDVSVIVKHSYHFLQVGLLVEQQWHVNQNKIAVGFL